MKNKLAFANNKILYERSLTLHDFFVHVYFLPRDALLSAVYAVVVCLSVCVCVCVCVCVRHTPVLYQNG